MTEREPTAEMVAAFQAAEKEWSTRSGLSISPLDIWRAMHDAAPEAPPLPQPASVDLDVEARELLDTAYKAAGYNENGIRQAHYGIGDKAALAAIRTALARTSHAREAALREALRYIDNEAPNTEPRDFPTVGFPASRDPEVDDGNDVVNGAFQEGKVRGLWEAAYVARKELALIDQPAPKGE